MELSQLSIKCLANMQMLTDTMAKAINELHSCLGLYYANYCELLKKENIISDKRAGFRLKQEKIGTIPPLEKEMEIRFELSFYQDKKTNPIKFSIIFGYWMESTQNIIYFQLFEDSETTFIEELLQSKDFIKSKSLSQEYQFENEDKKTIWVEILIDETFSLEKIKTCSELFKTIILMPILNQLK